MLYEANLIDTFCGDAISTTTYILNKSKIIVNTNNAPYELWNRKLTIVKYFKVFGRKCYVKINANNLGDSRNDEGIFLGYAYESKGCRCYKKR